MIDGVAAVVVPLLLFGFRYPFNSCKKALCVCEENATGPMIFVANGLLLGHGRDHFLALDFCFSCPFRCFLFHFPGIFTW